jgi:hypothetical protein
MIRSELASAVLASQYNNLFLLLIRFNVIRGRSTKEHAVGDRLKKVNPQPQRYLAFLSYRAEVAPMIGSGSGR